MFTKAERKQVKLKIGITGPSGSGKTFSALSLAKGLGGKIALLDTEAKSASLYADKFEFDCAQISPPFLVDKYLKAIEYAEAKGYSVLIIDSLSHAWAGEGGILETKSAADARGGNQYTNWRVPKEQQARLRSRLLQSNLHVIATMRAKQEYAISQSDTGKSKVQKLGLAPIQEPGMEYEFTTVFDIDMAHKAMASKDRTGLFADRIEMLSEKHGKEFIAWLEAAKPADEPAKNPEVADVLPFEKKEKPPVWEAGRAYPIDTTWEHLANYKGLSKDGTPLKQLDVEDLVDWLRKKRQELQQGKKIEAPLAKQITYVQEYLILEDVISVDERVLL